MSAASSGVVQHPFIFFGVAPPRDDGPMHWVEVRFRDAPTDAKRIAIARRYEIAVHEHGLDDGVDASAPLVWSDAWMLATFEVSLAVDDDPPLDVATFHRALSNVLRAVHELAPIREAHTSAAAGANDPWERWSIAHQPVPSAAPDWPDADFGASAYAWSQRRVVAASAVDARAERARADARAALATDPLDSETIDEVSIVHDVADI